MDQKNPLAHPPKDGTPIISEYNGSTCLQRIFMMSHVFSNATAYEQYMGRWSRPVARECVRWLDIAPGRTWLDVGAGTGILTQVILEQAAPQQVVAIDLSEQYLAYAQETIQDQRVAFQVGDATEITLETSPFDVAVAGLVLNFVTSPEKTVEGMKNAVREGGMVAAYVWDYTEGMAMLRHFWEAAIAVDPAARDFNAATQYALCNPDSLQGLFASAGLSKIEVRPLEIETPFASFDDFWLPFLGAQGSVSKYLKAVDENGRHAIQQQLRQQLPIRSDGTIPLTARAWSVKGQA